MGGEMGGQEGEAEIFDFPVAAGRRRSLEDTLKELRRGLDRFYDAMQEARRGRAVSLRGERSLRTDFAKAAIEAVITGKPAKAGQPEERALVGLLDDLYRCEAEFGSDLCGDAANLIIDIGTLAETHAKTESYRAFVERALPEVIVVRELLRRIDAEVGEDDSGTDSGEADLFDPVEVVRKALITVRLAERNGPEDFVDAFGNMIMMTEDDLLEALESGATDPAIEQILDVYDQGKDALSKDEFSVTTGEEIYKLQATVDIGALVEELEEILDIT